MLQDLARRIGVGIAAAILLGIGAGTTLVALAFAVYAGLKSYVGAAGASGLTALAAAALTGLCAVVLLGILKKPGQAAPAHHNPVRSGALVEGGIFALGLLADMAAGRRAKREQKAHDATHRRRR